MKHVLSSQYKVNLTSLRLICRDKQKIAMTPSKRRQISGGQEGENEVREAKIP